MKEAVLDEDKFFHLLRSIPLDKTVYPFTLQGKEYLESHWKRALDLSVGAAALIPSVLVIAAAAGALKIESPDLPAIITQQRHGIGNQKFPMFKLRSQEVVTEDNGLIIPTRVGAILRRLSIDELPQTINLIRGEMSAVGRRPTLDIDFDNGMRLFLLDLPYRRAKNRFGFTDKEWQEDELPQEKRMKIKEYAESVRKITYLFWRDFHRNGHGKPGLTGLYQVLGRRLISPENRVRLDLFYEKHATLGFDIAILLATIPAVLSRRGAR